MGLIEMWECRKSGGAALGESHVANNIRRLAGETVVEVWCIASGNASDVDLQNALDWACGPLADQGQVNCGPIAVGGACFDPDTTPAHSGYAFNEYFRRMNATLMHCDFNKAATITTIDPSECLTLCFKINKQQPGSVHLIVICKLG